MDENKRLEMEAMATSMKRIRERYMAAEQLLDKLEERREKLESAYISEHGILNPGGFIPATVNDIKDNAVRADAADACRQQMKESGLTQELEQAQAALRKAGKMLAIRAVVKVGKQMERKWRR